MIVILGDTTYPYYLERMAELGWGRMMVRKVFQPQPGEPWAVDNGAFGWASKGKPFQWPTWMGRMAAAFEAGHRPLFAVIPDVPQLDPATANPEDSLMESVLNWYHLPTDFYSWDWYLAVQDGMTPDRIDEAIADCHLDGIAGIFLGGSDPFKAREAKTWCDYAHDRGMWFHYARAGTPRKARHALEVGADSLDSTFPLWSRARFEAFVEAVCPGQSRRVPKVKKAPRFQLPLFGPDALPAFA